jgi:hypothetical protein
VASDETSGALFRRKEKIMRRVRFVVGLAVLAIVIALGACAHRAADPAVISLDGRTVPLSELRSEYDRINGLDQWQKATPEARRRFVDLYANKELLVRHAEKLYGPELTGRERIIYDRWLEKQENARYWKNWREAIPIPKSVTDSLRATLAEQRYLRQAVCQDETDAQTIYSRVRAGGDIEKVGKAYAASHPNQVAWADLGWAFRPRLATPIATVLFGQLKTVGEVAAPIRTQRYGWHVIELHGIRPADPAERDAEVDLEARRLVRGTAVANRNAETARAVGAKIDPQGLAVMMRGFAAMYDSLVHKTPGAPVDFQALEPPVERFSATELAMPLVRVSGEMMSLGGFLESLRKIDLDFWPTTGDTAKIGLQVRLRLERLQIMKDADAAKTTEAPDFQSDIRRKRQELYLDRFYREHLEVYGRKVNDADVAAFWQARGEAYRSRDLVGYSFIRFPPEDRGLATTTYNRIQEGMEWPLAASGARRADPNVIFEAQVDPTDGPPFPDVTTLALKYETGPEGRPIVTEPLELGSEFVILRILFRSHPETLTFETAKPFVLRDLQRLAVEDTLKANLDSLKKSLRLKIDSKAIA